MSSERLNVIALISGGKDSFFSLLHCIKHGHRVVALANLFPGPSTTNVSDLLTPPPSLSQQATDISASFSLPPGLEIIDPGAWAAEAVTTARYHGHGLEASEKDLNSFMYQTVGHEVLPLYAAATGLPLYRLPITGRAVHHERDYDATDARDSEETESMLPLLRAIMSRHPEVNALSAGAILSTYQRTRVESIAMRLGLVPLAFLWQYTVLPPPQDDDASNPATGNETQLLTDMANASLEARIIKVASAGLDESHLWERVSSEHGAERVKRALRKFGSSEFAAALGEGGEFETLVVDGPVNLFKHRIVIPENGRNIVREGGGCSWLRLSGARLEKKEPDPSQALAVRTPDLLDPKFKAIVDDLPPLGSLSWQNAVKSFLSVLLRDRMESASADIDVLRWSVFAAPSERERSIEEETVQIVEKIRELVSAAKLDPADISSTVIVLRHMADFPKVNGEYGKLFPKPNPPSRVTISCGSLLPSGNNIAVYVTAPSSQSTGRTGLHVQSRSYWAPANIGPYSQATNTSVVVQGQESGLRIISIAGQIPLIPATMVLPAPSDRSHELQVVLSLQHLWRVAQELKVQYWTSSVAYFPRCKSKNDMELNAKLVGHVWKQAHGTPEDADDSDMLDPWDLKYNTVYQTLGDNGVKDNKRTIPDWSVLTLRQQNEPETCIPPTFAVEVEELPRQSAVEWHAHHGLSNVDESSLELTYDPDVGFAGFKTWHSVVKAKSATVVYSAVSCNNEDQLGKQNLESLEQILNTVYGDSLRHLRPAESVARIRRPYLIYVDSDEVDSPFELTLSSTTGVAIIPCHSIWSTLGEKLKVVALYETSFPHGNGDKSNDDDVS
ncbi:hypothetical protein BGZ63DRAFT_420410 [Mariannaea sp. PMI_226]|nr:hypothetical protein BGZ63DRAFT_420410 [Mariannaea sp. PMI_226]